MCMETGEGKAPPVFCCKEAFGILPGADDGGYSLSGEAKEAALSRFALPENRKAALNVIRKLNESRDSNDNAL